MCCSGIITNAPLHWHGSLRVCNAFILQLLLCLQIQTGRIDDGQLVVVVNCRRQQLSRRQNLLLFGKQQLQRVLHLGIARRQPRRESLYLQLDALQVLLLLRRQLDRVNPLLRNVRTWNCLYVGVRSTVIDT